MAMTWLGEKCFQTVHRFNLVYNTCWEDPRLDRAAMRLDRDDHVLAITSAGCNVLDYVLDEPASVSAVDLNPLQNALLDLKIACIRTLDYADFFAIFGCGCFPHWNEVYQTRIRPQLSAASRRIWDRRPHFFSDRNSRASFYYRGSSGYFAWLVNRYIDVIPKVRETLTRMLDAASVAEQRALYQAGRVQESIWRPMLRWLVRRDTTMSMLGVPRAQREQIDSGYPGGLEQFIINALETVFTRLPLADNYFWRVYLTGQYTPTCCPEYLKESNFSKLRNGLIDRISTHTTSVEGFLRTCRHPISHFVLLDHMDWLCKAPQTALAREWEAILQRSCPRAKVLWRSAGLNADFIDSLQLSLQGDTVRVGELITYERDLAANLHARDRVHTYGSFYIANLTAA